MTAGWQTHARRLLVVWLARSAVRIRAHGRAWLAAGWLMAVCGAVLAQAVTVQDERGRVIRLPQPPQRIVSLLPSLTEMVCALGQCGRLVGVDRYTSWPASLERLPRVGGGLDPQIEAIVALRPDLVLAATSSRGADRLWALGIPVLALEPMTQADVQRVLGTVGQALGLAPSQAEQVWRDTDAGVTAVARSLPDSVRQARVYFEVNRGPYAAGEASFMGALLSRLGARNIVPTDLGPFPKLNPEFVVRANPDVIMISERHADDLGQRPGWAQIRALREQRVCVFTAAESDVLVRPGPRMAEAARLMARCLRDKAPAPRPAPVVSMRSGGGK